MLICLKMVDYIPTKETILNINCFGETFDVVCPKARDAEEFSSFLEKTLASAQDANHYFYLLIKANCEFSRTTPQGIKHTTFLTNQSIRVTLATIPLRHIEIDMEVDGVVSTLRINKPFINQADSIIEILKRSKVYLEDINADDLRRQYRLFLLSRGIFADEVFET